MDDLRQGVTPSQHALLDLFDQKAASLRHDFGVDSHLVVARERLKRSMSADCPAERQRDNILRAAVHLLAALEKLDAGEKP